MDDGWIELGNSCPGPNSIVRQVAEAPGFADQSHSTKVLRRLVGLTPEQLRAVA
jgi:AraC-like DNA-binding protein